VKENNNNNKKPNPILAFYIQTRGAHRQQSKGEKNTQNYEPNEFDLTSGYFEIGKWPKNDQNLLRTFIETFTPNFIQIRLVVLKKKIPENGPIRIS
jgi:hypothetical protein